MQIIPVIDLMQGQVVHAIKGQRDQYMPIHSHLCTSSEPLSVIATLCKLYSFDTFYIADIDAIRVQGNHEKIIKTISTIYPELTIWVDSGNYALTVKNKNIIPVIGSESLANQNQYKKVSQQVHVLSLDHDDKGPIGLTSLHYSPNDWPNKVICMTLNKVGSSSGVDLKRISQIQERNLLRKIPADIYAAGGVKDIADLEHLKKSGVAGVLIATALHQSKISAIDIAKFSK